MQTNLNSAVFAQDLAELQNSLHLSGISKFQVNFKKNKVTASCRYGGFNYGTRGTTLIEALNDLILRIQIGFSI